MHSVETVHRISILIFSWAGYMQYNTLLMLGSDNSQAVKQLWGYTTETLITVPYPYDRSFFNFQYSIQ